jgi:hypothetical protein
MLQHPFELLLLRKLCVGFSAIFFFILIRSLYELVCIELKFQALVLVRFKLVPTLLVGLTAHCEHRLEVGVQFVEVGLVIFWIGELNLIGSFGHL